jgi:hypothetical protein
MSKKHKKSKAIALTFPRYLRLLPFFISGQKTAKNKRYFFAVFCPFIKNGQKTLKIDEKLRL